MQAIFTHLAWVLSAAFAVAAAPHLLGLSSLRNAYMRWQVPPGFAKVTGWLLLAASACLLFPVARFAGLAIAALVMFLAATTLLHRGQYRLAAPVIALLFALIPVSLSGAV